MSQQEAEGYSASLREKAIQAAGNKDSVLARMTALERVTRIACAQAKSVQEIKELTQFFYDFATKQETP